MKISRAFAGRSIHEYEILFAVSDESDPAVPVVRRLMRDFPHIAMRLIVDRGKEGSQR